jgi:hypothetical protein
VCRTAGVARLVWFITRTIQSPSEGCVLSVSPRQVGLLTRIAAVARSLSHLYRQARGVGPGGRSPGPACRFKFGRRARPGAGSACDRFWISEQVSTFGCVSRLPHSGAGRVPQAKLCIESATSVHVNLHLYNTVVIHHRPGIRSCRFVPDL